MIKLKPLSLVLIIIIFRAFNLSYSSCQSFAWENATPEEMGFSSEKLDALRDTLAEHRTASILVIRNDRIVMEWYSSGWDQNRKHYTASLAKALVGGISLALALDDGIMNVDDPVSRFIPEWKNDPVRSKITIRHLATHSSGIEDAELSEQDIDKAQSQGKVIRDKHMDIPGWKGNFWRQDPDPFTMARDSAPVLFNPGTSYNYSNPGMAMLAYAITAGYRGSKYRDIRSLLRDRIYEPIGIRDDEWQIGYGKTFRIDDLELVANWGGGSFTPRAVARIGRLMLNQGNWEGDQLISSSLVTLLTGYAGTPVPPRGEKEPSPACGLAWYNNFDGVWQRVPRDTFIGSGAGNQTLIVIPSLGIIVVRNGENMYDPEKGEGHFYGIVNLLVNQLMDALKVSPYPESELIGEVKFAPESSIIRKAPGSDNWPVTWADDDNQYAAYGDGWGFEPKVEKKLSLGLAKIIGGPENFQGFNIRSETGEHTGDGINGKKASGMLMVNGVLYMWLRNAGENGESSQLAWSSDHGKTWEYSDWKFTDGFGCPTFLNFGRDYREARDNFVYIYSFDEKSAYKPSDRMVMARVNKNSISDRTAYEFIKSVDLNGNPVWTKNIDERGAVFKHPAMCYRSGITYNKGLKRYLWCQVHPDSKHPQGPRFQGGLGIYEAPEPWGPWHTVYYTREWDTGPGETACFPVKWMSEDGRTCYLLFSGNDSFSVRKAEFIITSSSAFLNTASLSDQLQGVPSL